MASPGSTRSATRMANVLASAQISMVRPKPVAASWLSNKTYPGNTGAHRVAATAHHKPDHPSPMACCMIMDMMVRLRVPMSLSTAISRILPSVMV